MTVLAEFSFSAYPLCNSWYVYVFRIQLSVTQVKQKRNT